MVESSSLPLIVRDVRETQKRFFAPGISKEYRASQERQIYPRKRAGVNQILTLNKMNS
jgi:hypothetical protein